MLFMKKYTCLSALLLLACSCVTPTTYKAVKIVTPADAGLTTPCLLYTSPRPRAATLTRKPSSD